MGLLLVVIKVDGTLWWMDRWIRMDGSIVVLVFTLFYDKVLIGRLGTVLLLYLLFSSIPTIFWFSTVSFAHKTTTTQLPVILWKRWPWWMDGCLSHTPLSLVTYLSPSLNSQSQSTATNLSSLGVYVYGAQIFFFCCSVLIVKSISGYFLLIYRQTLEDNNAPEFHVPTVFCSSE